MSNVILGEGDAIQLEDGKGVIHFACCDCHLTHSIVVVSAGGKVRLRFFGNNRVTAQRRRRAKERAAKERT